MTTPIELDDFEAALSDEERAVYQSFQTALREATHAKAVAGSFIAWASPIVSRLGGHNAGRVFGAFKARYGAQKTNEHILPLSELAEQLPYPLGLKLRGFVQGLQRRDEGETDPQFPFEIAATMGVVVRTLGVVALQAYVASGKTNAKLNHQVVDKLRAPSDGGWLELAQTLSKATAAHHPFAQFVAGALSRKVSLDQAISKQTDRARTPGQALQKLVSFRNDLIHGETITDARLSQACAQLELAVRGLSELVDYRLLVAFKDVVWCLNGALPRPLDEALTLPDQEPCLVHTDPAIEPFSLSPLLRFRPGEGEDDIDVDFDELFFLNAGSLERLSYIGFRAAGHLDGKSLGSYDAFRALMAKIPTPPIPKDPRCDFSGLAEFHSRLFVGRGPVLDELTGAVRERTHQYVVMKALAGMGKTAIFASLLQAVRNRSLQDRAQIPSPADALIGERDKYVFHFCMPTNGRNSPTTAWRSLICQICDHFEELDEKQWLSMDLDELKDEKFPALVATASRQLLDDQRLVIVIDALDEGIGAEKESVPSCIPAGDYPGVVFLLSYRVDADAQNSRVADQLKHIGDNRLHALQTANPLAGLPQADVAHFLARVHDNSGGAAASERTAEAVWAAAIIDAPAERPAADPFYLRFVADGVQAGGIRLDRAETVPKSLDDAFEEMWMGLPTARDFLCHRVLLTLGIMRDYGDDELFAELFNRDPELVAADGPRLTPDDVAALRVKAGKLLVYDGDKYGLFHDRFRTFLVGEQKDPIAEALANG